MPVKLDKKRKLELLTEFGEFSEKRKSDFPEVVIEGHELPIQFSGWLRENHPELIDLKDEIWLMAPKFRQHDIVKWKSEESKAHWQFVILDPFQIKGKVKVIEALDFELDDNKNSRQVDESQLEMIISQDEMLQNYGINFKGVDDLIEKVSNHNILKPNSDSNIHGASFLKINLFKDNWQEQKLAKNILHRARNYINNNRGETAFELNDFVIVKTQSGQYQSYITDIGRDDKYRKTITVPTATDKITSLITDAILLEKAKNYKEKYGYDFEDIDDLIEKNYLIGDKIFYKQRITSYDKDRLNKIGSAILNRFLHQHSGVLSADKKKIIIKGAINEETDSAIERICKILKDDEKFVCPILTTAKEEQNTVTVTKKPEQSTDVWKLTQREYQEQKAIEKTGSPMVLNAHDGHEHERLVEAALKEGSPVSGKVLEDYPWLIEEKASDEELHSATIGRPNDYVYQDFNEFEGDVIHQLEVQGEMTTSDAQGILMISSNETFLNIYFEKLENPVPLDAKKAAETILNRSATEADSTKPSESKEQKEITSVTLQDYSDFENAKGFAGALLEVHDPYGFANDREHWEEWEAKYWKLTEIPIDHVPDKDFEKDMGFTSKVFDYWEEKIKNGARPVVVLYRGEKSKSATDVLDGDHKILVYRKLGFEKIPALVGVSENDKYFSQYKDWYSNQTPNEPSAFTEDQQSDPLTNEHGVYTKETAGDNLETIKVDIPATVKTEVEIRIAKGSDGLFRYGLHIQKNFGDHSGIGDMPSYGHPAYSSRSGALEAALRKAIIELNTMFKSKDSILSKEEKKKKLIQKAIDAVVAFFIVSFDQNETPTDPYTNSTGYYNGETAGSRYETIKFSIPKSSKVDVTLSIVQGSDDLFRFGVIVRKDFGDQSTKISSPKISGETFNNRGEAVEAAISKSIEILKAYLETPDTILNNESGKIKNIQSAINALEALRDTDISEENQNPATTPATLKAVAVDIKSRGVSVPNVLVPALSKEPFISGSIMSGDAQKVHEASPGIISIKDKNLPTVPAVRLFELSQMPHPNDYGIEVSRGLLLSEWSTRGKNLFEELDFPTDLNYPYVNIHSGYKSVEKLGIILGTYLESWWSVVEHYRPIADLHKAIEFIESEVKRVDSERLELTNPQTKKPTTKNKEEYKKLTWLIDNFEGSKQIIQDYKVASKRDNQTSKDKKIPQEIWKLTLSQYLKRVTKNESDASDENFQWETKHDHRGKILQALKEGKEVPAGVLSDYPDLHDTQAFQMGFDTTDFKAVGNFQQLLEIIDNKEAYQIGYYSNHDRRTEPQGYLWQGKDIKMVTVSNPLLKEGYASFIGLEGKREKVLEAVNFIETHTDSLGGLGLEYVDFRLEFEYANIDEDKHPKEITDQTDDYIDRVIAHMHDNYELGKRVTKGQVEKLAAQLKIPNMGMMWEAVELSWLLWYKMLYHEHSPFERRLAKMIVFWNKIQPTYAYSDSSKEIYKQYSTPCPIAAIIAQYTLMGQAQSIFEPSAGNGLLVLGADPRKTHVNEIDKTRLESLKHQEFYKITSLNAAQPFPTEMTKAYDVVVTNPPFAKWEEEKFDKDYIIGKYFHNHIGLAGNIRLEHLMAGLALHTMKDTGRAAIIIMGHVYFKDRFIAKYRPFFNWLYRHYQVDDVINMNSFKLYNKQGAIEKTMLILVGGRKATPKGVSPTSEAAPQLYYMVNSFEELWQRVSPHIGYNLNTVINQLKIELGR